MATYEYNDLFLKCQNTGKYHVFTFDIVGSRNMDKRTRLDAHYKSIKMITMIYDEIRRIEDITSKKILVFEDDFVHMDEKYEGFGFKKEPFIFGDMVGFTIYRDSISDDTVISIYNEVKRLLNINFDFHVNDGYYETNNYEEGGTLYFRGYAIDLISNLHKEANKSLRMQLKKQS